MNHNFYYGFDYINVERGIEIKMYLSRYFHGQPYLYYWNRFAQPYYKTLFYFWNGQINHFNQAYKQCIQRGYKKRENAEQKYLNCLFKYMKSEEYNTIDYIILPENITTGFTWHYNIENKSIVQVVDNGYEEFEHEEGMVGVGGIHTWIIKPLKQGTTKIKFELYQDWLPNEVQKVKAYTIHVYSIIENGPLFIKIEEEYI